MKINEVLNEAIYKVPTHPEHFTRLKEIFDHPLPAGIAHAVIFEIIDDDDLNDRIAAMADENANADARILVKNWLELNMPDTIHKLKQGSLIGNAEGYYSPIHGYTDTNMDATGGQRSWFHPT